MNSGGVWQLNYLQLRSLNQGRPCAVPTPVQDETRCFNQASSKIPFDSSYAFKSKFGPPFSAINWTRRLGAWDTMRGQSVPEMRLSGGAQPAVETTTTRQKIADALLYAPEAIISPRLHRSVSSWASRCSFATSLCHLTQLKAYLAADWPVRVEEAVQIQTVGIDARMRGMQGHLQNTA